METKVIIRKNNLNLPADQLQRIEKAVDRKDIKPLSSDREVGLFLMYCCGDEIDSIAEQTQLPRDVIALTALTYDWHTKALELRKYRNGDKIADLQKDLVNTLLIATYASIKQDLALVIAGKKEAHEVGLIPRKIDGLEKLLNMVSEINNPNGKVPANKGGTVVQANNVQIVQNNQVAPEESKTKIERLRDLKEKQNK